MRFIGTDVHERICSVYILNGNNQVELELSDIKTSPEGFKGITESYSPNQCRIMIENSTRSHFVEKYFKGSGYDIVVAHTPRPSADKEGQVEERQDRCKETCRDIDEGDGWQIGSKIIQTGRRR